MSTTASRAVLVTGCSSGIGRAIAMRLAGHGWTVYATARRPETIEDLASSGCHLLTLDVCHEESMHAAVATVEETEGAVGVLVNNAGYGLEGAVEELAAADLRHQFETNLLGPLHLTQLVLPGMRRQHWGKVVNVSSVGGRITVPGGGAYHASKHAVEALSDVLRFEVRGFGIDVVLIEPGAIASRWMEKAVSDIEAASTRPVHTPRSTGPSPASSSPPTTGCSPSRPGHRKRWRESSSEPSAHQDPGPGTSCLSSPTSSPALIACSLTGLGTHSCAKCSLHHPREEHRAQTIERY